MNAYWHSRNTIPISSTVVVVETDKKLADIIADEFASKKKTASVDIARDLKLAKSFDGKDVKQLLDHPFSVFNGVIAAEKVKELHVVFEKPTQQQRTKPATYLDALTAASKPQPKEFHSKFTVAEVTDFTHGHAAAKNKEEYRLNYNVGKGKPSITDQHEAYVVSFLNNNKLTYLSGAGGQETRANDTVSKLTHVVQFLTEHRDVLMIGQVNK